MRVESLPLPTLVAGDGLLLVQLADVVLGVLGVSFFTCHRGEKEMEWITEAKDESLAE